MKRVKKADSQKRIKLFLILSTVCFAVNAVSVMFMPLSSNAAYTAGRRWLLLLNGIVFWGFLAMAFGLLIAANAERKEYLGNHREDASSGKSKPGIITFFSNKPAKIADISTLVFLILLIIMFVAKAGDKYITYVMLAFFLFSLNMHGVLNGKIYKTINSSHARRDEKNE